jgi:hypothetical protein
MRAASAPDSAAVLIDTRKWNAERVVVVKVPATDDGDVLGNSKSVVQRVVHRAHGQRIIETEDPIGPVLKMQELAHRFGAALFGFHIPLCAH